MELLKHKQFIDKLDQSKFASDEVCDFVNKNPYIQIVAINTVRVGNASVVDLYYKIDDEVTE